MTELREKVIGIVNNVPLGYMSSSEAADAILDLLWDEFARGSLVLRRRGQSGELTLSPYSPPGSS